MAISGGTHYFGEKGYATLDALRADVDLVGGLTSNLVCICSGVSQETVNKIDFDGFQFNGHEIEIRGEDSNSQIRGVAGSKSYIDIQSTPYARRFRIHDLKLYRIYFYGWGGSPTAHITIRIYNIMADGGVENDFFDTLKSFFIAGSVVQGNGSILEIYNNRIYNFHGRASAHFPVIYLSYATGQGNRTLTIENNTIYRGRVANPIGGWYYTYDNEGIAVYASPGCVVRNNVVSLYYTANCLLDYSSHTWETNATSDETGSEGLQNIVAADEFVSLDKNSPDFLRPRGGKEGVFTVSATPRTGNAPLKVAFSVDEVVTRTFEDSKIAYSGTEPTLATTDIEGRTRGVGGTQSVGAYEVEYTEEYDTQVA